MIKKFSKIFIMFAALVMLVGISSCDNASENNTNDSGNGNTTESKDPNLKDIYLDNAIIENESFKLGLKSNYCNGQSNNYSLSLYFDLLNKEYSTKTFTIKNAKLVKVSTKAEYTVNYNEKISIEAELTRSISFSATIPSDIKNDEYKLTFEIESYKVTFYLYETPDLLRTDRKVTYYINDYLKNTEVYTDTVKDKRKLSTAYTYESSDNQTYCNTWYTDSSFSTVFNLNTPITADTALYGRVSNNLKWMSLSSDVYSFVSGVNHVPSNGVLVIPSKYLNKEICINMYAIKDISVSKIYIPKTVHTIYSGNFTGIGNATVYYEGTEEEWKALFYMPSNVYTTNVVYNAKYVG